MDTISGWLWMEPAQFIKQVEDLVSLYTIIREQYQTAIDEAFDKASRQIGFVVLTSLPINVSVDANGAVSAIEMGAENMKGTVFESVKEVLAPMMKGKRDAKSAARPIAKGEYQLVVFWNAALKAFYPRLQPFPGEPVHFGPGVSPFARGATGEADYTLERIRHEPVHPFAFRRVWPEPIHQYSSDPQPQPWRLSSGFSGFNRVHMEPAHPYYSDPEPQPWRSSPVLSGINRIYQEPAHPYYSDPTPQPWRSNSVISAIDKVYPELNIGAQVAQAYRWRPRPGPWTEPAQPMAGSFAPSEQVLCELSTVLRKYGY